MNCFLIITNTTPPGGYWYEQKMPDKTVHTFHRFEFSSIREELFKFRVANNLDRADMALCEVDISEFDCQRRGCDPRWCRGEDSNAVIVRAQSKGRSGCSTCGRRAKK